MKRAKKDDKARELDELRRKIEESEKQNENELELLRFLREANKQKDERIQELETQVEDMRKAAEDELDMLRDEADTHTREALDLARQYELEKFRLQEEVNQLRTVHKDARELAETVRKLELEKLEQAKSHDEQLETMARDISRYRRLLEKEFKAVCKSAEARYSEEAFKALDEETKESFLACMQLKDELDRQNVSIEEVLKEHARIDGEYRKLKVDSAVTKENFDLQVRQTVTLKRQLLDAKMKISSLQHQLETSQQHPHSNLPNEYEGRTSRQTISRATSRGEGTFLSMGYGAKNLNTEKILRQEIAELHKELRECKAMYTAAVESERRWRHKAEEHRQVSGKWKRRAQSASAVATGKRPGSSRHAPPSSTVSDDGHVEYVDISDDAAVARLTSPARPKSSRVPTGTNTPADHADRVARTSSKGGTITGGREDGTILYDEMLAVWNRTSAAGDEGNSRTGDNGARHARQSPRPSSVNDLDARRRHSPVEKRAATSQSVRRPGTRGFLPDTVRSASSMSAGASRTGPSGSRLGAQSSQSRRSSSRFFVP
eukprot:Rmarinus@m.18124